MRQVACGVLIWFPKMMNAGSKAAAFLNVSFFPAPENTSAHSVPPEIHAPARSVSVAEALAASPSPARQSRKAAAGTNLTHMIILLHFLSVAAEHERRDGQHERLDT